MHISVSILSAALLVTQVADQPVRPSDCGMGATDWCPAPPGDPCGRHRDVASCKADPKCYGMPYRGLSYVPCMLDERGFASNCPTVGCTSTPPRRRPRPR
jgi:hypothetical protein